MFKILADGSELWSSNKDRVKLGSPTLSLALNSVGSLTFKIYPDHELYNSLEKLKTIVSVYQDDELLFKGRIYSDKVDMYKIKTVEAEGLLGYFNDSIVRPYDFTGSVSDYVKKLLDQHNEQVNADKVIKLGRVTVTDPNDYIVRASSDYPTTWKEIDDKLLDLLGGYLVLRYETSGMYLDYLADFEETSTQSIAFGVNLLDLDNEVTGEDVATRIIPRGASVKSEDGTNDKRVDITSVNGGKDYITNDSAEAKYGTIYQVVTWDDVTEPANLLKKAKDYLTSQIKLSQTLTLKAVDLHLSDKTIERFRLGNHINVISGPHNIVETILLSAYKLDLSNPANCTISADASKVSFTDTQIKNKNNVTTMVNKVQDNVNKVTAETLKELEGVKATAESAKEGAIEYTDETLKSYYTKTETDSQISASADKITLEMSKTYVTEAQTEQIVTDKVNNATADLLRDYSTTEEMNSAIQQSAKDITTTVSKNYATNEALSAGITEATNNAIEDTTQKLKNYSTTTDMNSAIQQSAESITSTVSKNYTTKEEFNGLTVGAVNMLSGAYSLTGTKWIIGNYLTDVNGNILTDKDGNILIG